jgi:hypothetical protein
MQVTFSREGLPDYGRADNLTVALGEAAIGLSWEQNLRDARQVASPLIVRVM